MLFRVDRSSALAPYAQLVRQVREAVRMGWLVAGDRLPTIRKAVLECGVNANTVHKAYRELALLGVVEARQGAGTFVRDGVPTVAPEVMAHLRSELAGWVDRARAAGLGTEDLAALLATALVDRTRV